MNKKVLISTFSLLAVGVPGQLLLHTAPSLPHHHARLAGVRLRAGGARGTHSTPGAWREEWGACC